MGYPLIESVHLKPLSTRNKNYPAYLQLPEITSTGTTTSLNNTSEGNENIFLSSDQNGNINVELNGEPGTGRISVSATNDLGLTTQKEFNFDVIEDGDGGTDEITFTHESARFIKVTSTKRARENFGYSLFEIEVYQE